MALSSDDEIHLADLVQRHRPEESQDSDLPAWIQAHTPVKAPVGGGDDSDDDATAPTGRPDGEAGTSTAGAGHGGAGSSKAAAAGAAAPKQATAAGLPAVSVLNTALGEGAAAHIPLLLPEKLLRHKVLVELEPAPHQATELSGDAGAVGRIIASTEAGADGCFKVDLKGMLYAATVLPLAGTALVANIGPTEAKVEAVINDFVRLREESSYLDGGMLLEGGGGLNELMADDEDNYQVGDMSKDAAGAKPAGKKASAAAAAKRKAGAKGAKKGAGSKALKPAAAGVKKKRAPAASKAAGPAKRAKAPAGSKKPQAAAAAAGGKAAAAKAAGAKGAAKGKAGGTAGAKAGAKKRKQKDFNSEAEDTESDSGGAGGDSDWSMD